MSYKLILLIIAWNVKKKDNGSNKYVFALFKRINKKKETQEELIIKMPWNWIFCFHGYWKNGTNNGERMLKKENSGEHWII